MTVKSIKHSKEKRVLIPSREEAGQEAASPKVKAGKDKADYPINPVVHRGQDPELFWLHKYGADDQNRFARQALEGVRYTILHTVEARPEFGVLCDDLFHGGRAFLMDRGLSKSATKYLAIATAVYPAHNWLMTSGAALPLPAKDLDLTIVDLFEAASVRFSHPARLSKKDASKLAFTMIRLSMMSGALNHVEYR